MYIRLTNSSKLSVVSYITKLRKRVVVNKKVKYIDILKAFESREIIGITVLSEDIGHPIDCNYKEFRGTFKSMDVFYEDTVDEVLSSIKYHLGVDIDKTKVSFKLQSGLSSLGIFDERKREVVLRMSLVRESYTNPVNRYDMREVKSTIVHEIGHYIHFEYLGNRDVKLPPSRNRRKVIKNHLEDFAYCFEDLVYAMQQGDVLTDRELYLKDLIGKYVQ